MSHEEASGQAIGRRELLIATGAGLGALLLSACNDKEPAPHPPAPKPAPPHEHIPTDAERIIAAVTAYTPYLPTSHYIEHGPVHKANVSVTIDDFSSAADSPADGPKYLEGLLKLGEQFQTTFTMFPIGSQLDKQRKAGYASLWREAASAGHIIGNHTYHHQLKPLPAATFKNELIMQHQALTDILGYNYPKQLMRPPGGIGGYKGSPNPSWEAEYQRYITVVRDLGYYMTMWGTDSNTPDNRLVTANEDSRFLHKIFNDPAEHVRNGSIILVHPTTLSLNGMKQLLTRLQSDGYNCLSVPALFAPHLAAEAKPTA